MSTYDISKIQLPNGDICNLRDQNAKLLKNIQITNLIHIEDAAAKPLKDCKISINPVQDLHGYDKPWVGGAGKNLIEPRMASGTINGITCTNNGDGSFTINGTATGVATFRIDQSERAATDNLKNYTQGTYTVSGLSNSISLRMLKASDSSILLNITNNGTSTLASDQTGCLIYIRIASGTFDNVVIKPQLEKGSSASAWEPYSNICPIEGWDEANVTRCGKNLFDESNLEMITVLQDGTTKRYGKKFDNLIPGSYTVSAVVHAMYSRHLYAKIVSSGGSFGTAIQVADNSPGSATIQISSGESLLIYADAANAADGADVFNLVYDVQLESGSTATAYEPYNSETVDVQFPAEAGTVYGGTLMINSDGSGMMEVDKAVLAIDSFGSLSSGTSAGGLHWADASVLNINASGNVICSVLGDRKDGNAGWGSNTDCYGIGDTIRIYTTETTNDGFKAKYNDACFVYTLANPTTYLLTATQLCTLLGTNNIWADAGNISCIYYVNSDLNTELDTYIPKSIGITVGDVAEYKTLTNQEIATFNNNIQNNLLKNYSIKIEPKQDLHGYDKPWVGGAGKNLLPDSGYVQGVIDWNSSNADGITNNIHFISSPYIKISANTQYAISSFAGNIVRIYVTDENHSTLYFLGNYPTAGTNRIIPATAGAYYVRISIGIDDQTVAPSDYGTKVYGQLETGATATSYAPYSNVCPIEGFDTVNVISTGKNLIPSFGIGWIKGSTASWYAVKSSDVQPVYPFTYATSGASAYTDVPVCVMACLPNTTYTITPPTGLKAVVTEYNNKSDTNNMSKAIKIWQSTTMGYTVGAITRTTSSKTHYLVIGFTNWNGSANITVQKSAEFQLEFSSTATSYEPYQGNILSFNFVSFTGSTVYGGTLTVNEDGSGTLIVDRIYSTLPECSTVGNSGIVGSSGKYAIFNVSSLPQLNDSLNDITIIFDSMGTVSRANRGAAWCGYVNDADNIGCFVPSNYTQSQVTEALTGTHFAAKLLTPITYTLTASQLTILLGTNHIWTDAGNITITYPTNLKGYIDNINNRCITKSQQTQAVFYGLAASAGDSTQKSSNNTIGIYTDEAKGYILHMLGLDAIIGNYELDEYADKNYSVDQLFMMKGKLYKATSFIPQGGSIVPNTNCIQTTILENLINQTE